LRRNGTANQLKEFFNQLQYIDNVQDVLAVFLYVVQKDDYLRRKNTMTALHLLHVADQAE
jgi:hypothetical protein